MYQVHDRSNPFSALQDFKVRSANVSFAAAPSLLRSLKEGEEAACFSSTENLRPYGKSWAFWGWEALHVTARWLQCVDFTTNLPNWSSARAAGSEHRLGLLCRISHVHVSFRFRGLDVQGWNWHTVCGILWQCVSARALSLCVCVCVCVCLCARTSF